MSRGRRWTPTSADTRGGVGPARWSTTNHERQRRRPPQPERPSVASWLSSTLPSIRAARRRPDMYT